MRIKPNNASIFTARSFLLITTITSIHSHLINYTETLNQLSAIGEKQFKGTWQLSPLDVAVSPQRSNRTNSSCSFPNYFNDLVQNNGDTFLSIAFSAENKHRPVLSFELSLLDGVYKETWIKLVSSRPFRYENQSYYFDMFIDYTAQSKPKRQVITLANEYANYSSYKLCKVIQHYKSKYMPIDNITITLEGGATLSSVKGNIVSFLSEFNLTFRGELLTQSDISSNRLEMKYFLFGFAVVGLIHFFTLMSTIKAQRSKRNFHFRNFCPYLIANDMVFNCVVFISASTLSFEYKSQGEGFAVMSLLYFVMFAFIEGVVLYFTFNFENVAEMKRLLITCAIAIASFIVIGNFLFVCELFITLLLYSSFIPQIVYNVFHFQETPNAIPKKNILGLMLNKMYLPLYLKGYSGNVFKTKVNNTFVWSYVAALVTFIEMNAETNTVRWISVYIKELDDKDFEKYDLIIAPMQYMVSRGLIDKIERYVKDGGHFYATYMLGMVNETDLCYLGGFPGERLKEVFGIWNEEIDTLYPEERGEVEMDGVKYLQKDYAELIHANTATVLARYTKEFYAGMPALTINTYGKGKAYYQAFRDEGAFTEKALTDILTELNIQPHFPAVPPNQKQVLKQ